MFPVQLSEDTLSKLSVGVMKVDLTTGFASTHGTTHGETKVCSRLRWATAASTIKCTLAKFENKFCKDYLIEYFRSNPFK